MLVTFTKVDAKRYLVAIEREHGPPLVPRFAPGYDDLMPHDLAHFLVEEQFEIELGVFGQLAAGGSGIFKPDPGDDSVRFQRSAHRLASIGRDDMARSEKLVALCVAEWERAIGRRRHPRGDRVDQVEPEMLQAVVQRLQDMAVRWGKLQRGSSLTLEWPRRLTFDASKSRRGRRQPHRTPSGQRPPAALRH
jgi:hypothetical protein